jgi:hypothetical protein
MSVKTKAIVSIVINTLMTLVTAGIVISYFFTKNFLIKTNSDIFCYFTTDSNVFVAIAAIIIVIFDIQILRGKRAVIPKPAMIFKFAGVVAVMVTMVTCLVYLAPKYGFSFIFGGTFFHVHLAAPLMAFVSFCFFEKGERLGLAEAQLAHIPCAIYAVVYFVMVVVIGEKNGGWRDLYHFGEDGQWYVFAVLLTAQEIVILLVTRLIYNIGKPKK